MVCFKAFPFIFSLVFCQFSKCSQTTDWRKLSEQGWPAPPDAPCAIPQSYPCLLSPTVLPATFPVAAEPRKGKEKFHLRRQSCCKYWHKSAPPHWPDLLPSGKNYLFSYLPSLLNKHIVCAVLAPEISPENKAGIKWTTFPPELDRIPFLKNSV